MDRLTSLYDAGKPWSEIEKEKPYSEVYRKLQACEDLEEQGLILRLPCKVGDTVYRLIPKTYRHIEPLKVSEFVICDNGLCFTTEKTNFYYSCEEFGEFIFLTKEEAEWALKQMGERKDEQRFYNRR